MNRWKIVFSGASLLTLFFFLFFSTVCVGKGKASNIRQRSDGCGPHPLIALAAASRPFGSNGAGNLNDVLRAVRADSALWPVMQNLLRRYDDCIRAADGLHYKRSDDSVVTRTSLSSSTVPLVNSFSSGSGSGKNGGGKTTGSSEQNSIKRSKGSSFTVASFPDYITGSGNDIIPWLQNPI